MTAFPVRRALSAVVLALLVAASGCGRDDSPQPAASGLDPLQPPPAGQTSSAAPGVELGTVSAGMVSMPWKLVAISADQRTITVQYVSGDGSCVRHVGHHLVREGQSLLLGEYSRSNNDPACPAMLQLGTEAVSLPAALDGTLDLVHVPASQSWAGTLD